EVREKLGSADLELREPASCTNAIYVLNRDIMDPATLNGVTPDRLRASTLRVIYRVDHAVAVEADGVAARDFGFGPVPIGGRGRGGEGEQPWGGPPIHRAGYGVISRCFFSWTTRGRRSKRSVSPNQVHSPACCLLRSRCRAIRKRGSLAASRLSHRRVTRFVF